MNYRIALASTLLAWAGLMLCVLPSCSSGSKGSGQADSTESTYTESTLRLDSIVVNDTYYDNQGKKKGPSVDVYLCYRYLAGDSVIEHLFNRIALGDKYAPFTPQDAVATYLKDIRSEYMPYEDNQGELSPEDTDRLKSEVSVFTEIRYTDSLLISVRKELSEYRSGAIHGMYGTGLYMIDRKAKKILSESDLFVDDYTPELSKILQRQALIDHKCKTLQELEDKEGIYAGDIAPNDNFSISPEGLTYIYNPYEIAPYAVGQVEIFVPMKELAPILRPGSLLEHYLPH